VTRAEFLDEARRIVTELAAGELAPERLLHAARLWNTILYYTDLQSDPAGQELYLRMRDDGVRRLLKLYDWRVGRGMSLETDDPRFILGGTMQPEFRFTLDDVPD